MIMVVMFRLSLTQVPCLFRSRHDIWLFVHLVYSLLLLPCVMTIPFLVTPRVSAFAGCDRMVSEPWLQRIRWFYLDYNLGYLKQYASQELCVKLCDCLFALIFFPHFFYENLFYKGLFYGILYMELVGFERIILLVYFVGSYLLILSVNTDRCNLGNEYTCEWMHV